MIKRFAMALGTFLVVSAVGFGVTAGGVMVPAASGYPYQNTGYSNYTIKDGSVTFSNRGWAIPLPMDPTVTRTYKIGIRGSSWNECSAWVLDGSNGAVRGGYSNVKIVNGQSVYSDYATVSVPSWSSVFVRVTAGSYPATYHSAFATY
jgi:hypothetical protein